MQKFVNTITTVHAQQLISQKNGEGGQMQGDLY